MSASPVAGPSNAASPDELASLAPVPLLPLLELPLLSLLASVPDDAPSSPPENSALSRPNEHATTSAEQAPTNPAIATCDELNARSSYRFLQSTVSFRGP